MGKRNAIGNIGTRFKAVLFLLAALSITSYAIQEFFIVGQTSSATEINVAGRQRMLSQRISLLATRLTPPEQSLDEEEAQALRHQFINAVNLMQKSHEALTQGDPLQGIQPLTSKMLQTMYFGPELHLDRDVRAYLSLARPLSEEGLNADQLEKRKKAFFAFNDDRLLVDLNTVVERYEEENKSRFENLGIYQALSLIAILGALFASWMAVFQPLVRQLNKYIGTIFKQSFDLRGSEDRFRSITDSSQLAMIIAVDENSQIISWNPAAERFFGYSEEDAIGMDANRLVPKRHRELYDETFTQALASKTPQLFGQAIEAVGMAKDRHEFPIEISLGSWRQGGKKFFSAIVHDISPRIEAERAIKATASRLERAQKVAHLVHWEWDLETGVIITNEEGVKLLGRDPSVGQPTPEWFFSGIFAPDKRLFRSTIISGIKSGEPIQLEYRFMRGNNHEDLCWLHMDCAFERDKNGKVVRMVGAARDITKEKNLASTLIAAKEEAELANRAKSTFLANMSHELRTPLNAIIGFSDIIRDEMLGPIGTPAYLDYATDINTSGTHLLGIIGDILDVSKIESGKMDFHDETVDLAEVIQSCSTILDQRIKEGRLTFEIDIPETFPCLRADGLRLKQIALNLLTNSVKFTPPGGTVRFAAEITGDGNAALTFSDTGKGIEAEDIPLVMRPFFQSGDMHNSPQEGNGLGLYISRSLVELHGGELKLESTVGEGTTITVTLPTDRIIPLNTPADAPIGR